MTELLSNVRESLVNYGIKPSRADEWVNDSFKPHIKIFHELYSHLKFIEVKDDTDHAELEDCSEDDDHFYSFEVVFDKLVYRINFFGEEYDCLYTRDKNGVVSFLEIGICDDLEDAGEIWEEDREFLRNELDNLYPDKKLSQYIPEGKE